MSVKAEPAVPAGEIKLAGHVRGFSLTAHSFKGADPGMQSFGAASIHLAEFSYPLKMGIATVLREIISLSRTNNVILSSSD